MAPSLSVTKGADQLTFNVALVAYDPDIDIKSLPKGQRLAIRELKRNSKVSDLPKDYVAPSIEPTEQELSIDQSECVGIWVGMRPSNAADYATKAGESNSTKGRSINALALKGGYKVLATDPKALRVVVPMNRETASYYVLAQPDDQGLCSAFNVVVTEVFFFPQYRTDAQTDTAKRKSEWADLVRKVSNPIEKITFSRNYDKTKFVVAPKRALANELSSFIGTYLETRDRSILKSAIDLLDRVDTEGAFAPPHRNTALARLATSTTKMSLSQCNEALSELLVLAPDLGQLGLSAEKLQSVNAGLVAGHVVLPYTHLRAFIVQYIHEIETDKFDPDDEEASSSAALRCSIHVSHQLGSNPRFLDREAEVEGITLILDGQKKAMEHINTYISVAVDALKDSQGDSAIGTAPTLPQIWQKYGLSPDLDSAKMYALGVHRHNVQALRAILGPVETMLKENCEQLEKLRVGFSDAEVGQDGGTAEVGADGVEATGDGEGTVD